MVEQEENFQFKEDSITLKDIFAKINEWRVICLENWKVLGLIVGLILTMAVVNALLTPTRFKPKISFMVNTDDGSRLVSGGLTSLLGTLGLSGGSDYNLQKILFMMNSRNIVSRSLFGRCNVNGKNDFYANHLIRMYDFHELWEDSEDPNLHNFLFTHDSIAAFNRTENTAMIQLAYLISGNKEKGVIGLLTSDVDDATAIMTMFLETEKDTLSVEMIKTIYKNLSNFYIERSIERELIGFQAVSLKSDSIRQALIGKKMGIARHQDQNHALLFQTTDVPKEVLQADAYALTEMYQEAMKNQLIAELSIKGKLPYVSIIDSPIYPTDSLKTNWIMLFVKFSIVGLVLALAAVIGRYEKRKALEQPYAEPGIMPFLKGLWDFIAFWKQDTPALPAG